MRHEDVDLSGTNKLKIVVIDDYAIMRASVRKYLEAEPTFVTVEFSNGNAAIEYMRLNSVNMVVTDIFMSKGSGFDVLRYVRNRTLANDIPIVFFSGASTKEDIVEAIEAGASGYVLKPFNGSDLLEKVKSVLQNYLNPDPYVKSLREAEKAFYKGLPEEAEIILTDLNQSGSKSPRTLTSLAEAKIHLNKNSEGLKLIEEAVKLNPMYFPAYALGTELHLKENNKDEAINWILKELEINSKRPHRRKLLASIYFEKSEIPEAINQLKLAMKDSPRDEDLQLKLAEYHKAEFNNERAMHFYERARRVNPESILAIEGIVNVFVDAQQTDKALKFLEHTIKDNPKQNGPIYVRCCLNEKLENFDDALADLEVLVIRDESNMDYLKKRAKIFEKLLRNAEALETWKQIWQYNPNDREACIKVGHLALKLENYGDAFKAYFKLFSDNPLNSKYAFKLGFIYEQLKKDENAYKCYKKAFSLDPKNVDAKKALDRLAPKIKQ